MGIALAKDSIDLGIIVTDGEAALAFYRDVVGLTEAGSQPMPGGGTMYRLMCGTSMIKLVQNGKTPPAVSPPGGIGGSTGFRYFTITVSNIEEITAAVKAAGHKVAVPVTALRPGITISIVEDPEGNWVEFLQPG